VELILIGVAAAAFIISIAAWLQLSALKRRFATALSSATGDSIEAVLGQHLQRVEAVDERLSTLNAEYQRLSVTNSLASQKISIVRFNPFEDTGGDQSFCLAVLDAHNSGYVLSSIHGREGTRVYVKPVDFGKSKYPLSAEEQQALTLAEQRVPKE
jgi:hypothetical protein